MFGKTKLEKQEILVERLLMDLPENNRANILEKLQKNEANRTNKGAFIYQLSELMIDLKGEFNGDTLADLLLKLQMMMGTEISESMKIVVEIDPETDGNVIGGVKITNEYGTLDVYSGYYDEEGLVSDERDFLRFFSLTKLNDIVDGYVTEIYIDEMQLTDNYDYRITVELDKEEVRKMI